MAQKVQSTSTCFQFSLWLFGWCKMEAGGGLSPVSCGRGCTCVVVRHVVPGGWAHIGSLSTHSTDSTHVTTLTHESRLFTHDK